MPGCRSNDPNAIAQSVSAQIGSKWRDSVLVVFISGALNQRLNPALVTRLLGLPRIRGSELRIYLVTANLLDYSPRDFP